MIDLYTNMIKFLKLLFRINLSEDKKTLMSTNEYIDDSGFKVLNLDVNYTIHYNRYDSSIIERIMRIEKHMTSPIKTMTYISSKDHANIKKINDHILKVINVNSSANNFRKNDLNRLFEALEVGYKGSIEMFDKNENIKVVLNFK